MPNSPVYKSVDPITEEEPQGEAYENIDVTKGAQNRYGWYYTFCSLPLWSQYLIWYKLFMFKYY